MITQQLDRELFFATSALLTKTGPAVTVGSGVGLGLGVAVAVAVALGFAVALGLAVEVAEGASLGSLLGWVEAVASGSLASADSSGSVS